MIVPLFINIILVLAFVRSTTEPVAAKKTLPNNVLKMPDDEFSEFLITKLNNLDDCMDISKIFPSEALSSDENKCIILDKIYGVLGIKDDDSIKEQNEVLKNICRMIFNLVNLEDEVTRNFFHHSSITFLN